MQEKKKIRPKEIFNDFVRDYLKGDIISENDFEIRFLFPGKNKTETEIKDFIKEKFMDYRIKNDIDSIVYTIAVDLKNNPDYAIIVIGF